MRLSIIRGAIAAVAAFGAMEIGSLKAAEAPCYCSQPAPPPVVREYAPRDSRVCVSVRMSDADWRACETKTWTFSTRGDRMWSERFYNQTATICRPYGHPNFGYRGKATGYHYIVRFQ